MSNPGAWLALAAAGAVGTLARYVAGGWLAQRIGSTFPWETCLINIAGCLAIGGLAGFLDRGGLVSATQRTVLMIGLLGGFTTFSTFGLELFRLVQDGQWMRAIAYIAVTNAGGFAAVWLGVWIATLA
jgi:CrcB protein